MYLIIRSRFAKSLFGSGTRSAGLRTLSPCTPCCPGACHLWFRWSSCGASKRPNSWLNSWLNSWSKSWPNSWYWTNTSSNIATTSCTCVFTSIAIGSSYISARFSTIINSRLNSTRYTTRFLFRCRNLFFNWVVILKATCLTFRSSFSYGLMEGMALFLLKISGYEHFLVCCQQ